MNDVPTDLAKLAAAATRAPRPRDADALIGLLRMTTKAHAIAARDRAADAGAREAERMALAAFYDETVRAEEPAERAVERLVRRFSADVRAGRFDTGPRRDAALALLRQAAGAPLS